MEEGKAVAIRERGGALSVPYMEHWRQPCSARTRGHATERGDIHSDPLPADMLEDRLEVSGELSIVAPR